MELEPDKKSRTDLKARQRAWSGLPNLILWGSGGEEVFRFIDEWQIDEEGFNPV